MAYSGPPDSKFFPGGALLICRLLASALIIAIFTPLWEGWRLDTATVRVCAAVHMWFSSLFVWNRVKRSLS